MRQNITLGGRRDSAKSYSELGKVILIINTFGNLVEQLWHRVQGGDGNLDNHVQNAP